MVDRDILLEKREFIDHTVQKTLKPSHLSLTSQILKFGMERNLIKRKRGQGHSVNFQKLDKRVSKIDKYLTQMIKGNIKFRNWRLKESFKQGRNDDDLTRSPKKYNVINLAALPSLNSTFEDMRNCTLKSSIPDPSFYPQLTHESVETPYHVPSEKKFSSMG